YRQHRAGIFRKLRYLDVSKPFPFPSNSFDFVYSSHMFEHIPKGQLSSTLREIYRVLKSGGLVRTVVPDLDYFIGQYNPQNPDEFVAGVFEIEHSATKNRHHWMYNRHSLPILLRE